MSFDFFSILIQVSRSELYRKHLICVAWCYRAEKFKTLKHYNWRILCRKYFVDCLQHIPIWSESPCPVVFHQYFPRVIDALNIRLVYNFFQHFSWCTSIYYSVLDVWGVLISNSWMYFSPQQYLLPWRVPCWLAEFIMSRHQVRNLFIRSN